MAIIAVIAIVLILWLVITAALSLAGLIFFLFIAGVVGWLADLVVPGELPYGFIGSIAAGIVGSIIGHALIGNFGPSLAGINLIPAVIGAIIFAFVLRLILGQMGR